ncbi:tellurite resistance TerB family protein [Pseudooctadecabacter jejudonensis]|uniref:Dna-J like membrane chaperone protein n=1 Tax=Pseudooctadecabacter jejudonensis TaxID=1391910 RepID=A0A1Y5RXG2_9RHOB|nr:TerB family tellurite resistance protein [Pseudooctadecabacter jejudonensis]SLN26686.1 Dna-J like membrane chaperone protein [Pseudooctadecabacter jejudonensis]
MRRLFLSFSSALAMGVTLFAATPAQATVGQYGTDLRFVTHTTIPSPGGGEAIALCHLVDYMHVLFIPVYTTVEGYALATGDCTAETYRDLSTENLMDLKAAGFVPQNVPDTPHTGWADLAWGHAWLIIGAIGLLYRGLTLLPMGRRKRRAAAPDTLAIHSLVAMSQVAVADGTIDDREIRQISTILTRLTGQGYSMERVAELLQRLKPTPSDLAQVGADLTSNDRQIVLEAALNIAVADGEIHPSEYAVVSDLAQRMKIGADQFRAALHRISAHMSMGQAA